jgi:hypothetical protein
MNTDTQSSQETGMDPENSGGRRAFPWRRPAGITAFVLLIPILGNMFVSGWNWNVGSFIFAGILVFSTGLTYELVVRRVDNLAYRFATAIGLLAGFLLVWVNAAVGIIGSEDTPANLLYGGVLAIGILGTIAARLQPRGMSLVLFAMALAQMIVPVMALLFWPHDFAPGVEKVFLLNAVFAAFWVGSATLFRIAARRRPSLGLI